ncbi:hypothetical protein HAX54_046380 [Datura stramonium]|uniref:Uncharacterized protein n=1 Tax=Datura stramonium TaxID=4076 RepID=A0ABS8WJE8_DATST|nr:hypothetical protein [Datura stramonium]
MKCIAPKISHRYVEAKDEHGISSIDNYHGPMVKYYSDDVLLWSNMALEEDNYDGTIPQEKNRNLQWEWEIFLAPTQGLGHVEMEVDMIEAMKEMEEDLEEDLGYNPRDGGIEIPLVKPKEEEV